MLRPEISGQLSDPGIDRSDFIDQPDIHRILEKLLKQKISFYAQLLSHCHFIDSGCFHGLKPSVFSREQIKKPALHKNRSNRWEPAIGRLHIVEISRRFANCKNYQ
jgi:hypothetical protein